MNDRSPDDDDRTVVDSGSEPGEGQGEAPSRIGPYRLIRELGQGGMGEVFLAEQLEPVQREVALKLIAVNRHHGAEAAMFEVERQILARMHHPAIAQVFDAGKAEDGRPWFAMEWVRGEAIIRHADTHALDAAERLRLFIRVCAGIQHAHQQGVIHRDIKPGNVLVDRIDGQSMPKIIDFGVATGVIERHGRATSDSTDRAGTRGYMSPELLAGPASEVDTRTDVYSLGVLLFELLTERRPPPADHTDALETVRRQLIGTTRAAGSASADRGPSKARLRRLPRELRFILAKALAPEREARYESAAALARDIQCYLDGERVAAVPDSRAYRMRKFIARNALAVAAVAAVVVALVAGLVVAVYGLLEARAQAERAEQIAAFTTKMLSSIDPQIADGAETPVLDRVLADASDRVGRELSGQPTVRAELELTIGQVYAALGQGEPARRHLESVMTLLPERRPIGLYLKAGAERVLLDLEDAALEAADMRLTELIAEAERHRPDSRLDWLNLLSIQGALRFDQARYEEAIAVNDRVLSELEPTSDQRAQGIRISTLRQNAQVRSDQMNLDEAARLFEDALAQTRIWESPLAPSRLSSLLNDFAVVRLRQQRYADGEALLREAIELSERLYGSTHPRVITQYGNLGGAIRQQGGQDKLDESMPFYERARELSLARYGVDHPRSVAATYNLGNAYLDLGRTDEVLSMHREAFDHRAAFSSTHMFQGLAFLGVGRSELAAGDLAAARDHLEVAVDRLGELVGEDFLRRLEAMEALAETFESLGEPERAAALRSEVADLRSDRE